MTGFTPFAPRRALGHVAFIAFVGAAALAFAAPASARPGTATSSASLSSSADNGGASTQAPRRNHANASERQICVDDVFINSRIPRRICKTESQWETAGGLEQLTDR